MSEQLSLSGFQGGPNKRGKTWSIGRFLPGSDNFTSELPGIAWNAFGGKGRGERRAVSSAAAAAAKSDDACFAGFLDYRYEGCVHQLTANEAIREFERWSEWEGRH